jgi:methyltransferase
MKILLIEPPISPFDVPTGNAMLPPAHHLERLAGTILHNHDVEIIDMRIDDTEKDLIERINSFKPDVVGSSSVAANSRLTKHVLGIAKGLNPEIKTVVGGHHPSLYPQDFENKNVDYVVIGEGEITFPELLRSIETNKSIDSVLGVAYKRNGRLKYNGPRPVMKNLDNLAMPAWHLTQKYRAKNLYFRLAWRPIDLTFSSRGCNNACDFCGNWKMWQKTYRFRKPQDVVHELSLIPAKHVIMVDDNTLDYKDSYKLAEKIERADLNKSLQIYGRAKKIADDPKLVEKWRRAGMETLLIGLESIDKNRLKQMRKNTTPEINDQAIKVCKDLGVQISAYFIVNPNFAKGDFDRLSNYIFEKKLNHPVFTILVPFPGTDLYENAKNKVTAKSLDLFDYFHSVFEPKLGLEKFYEEFSKLYSRHYPFSIKNFVLSLTSPGAANPFKYIKGMYNVKKGLKNLYKHHLNGGDESIFLSPSSQIQPVQA